MNLEGLTSDFFTLFALPPVFHISLAALEERYLALQRETHPDRFANAPEKTRRLSMQLAARINEGYQTLKQPLSRALYLLERPGINSGVNDRHALPTEFLMEQMEWREDIVEARAGGNAHELERLYERLKQDLAKHYETLGSLLDEKQDYPNAADLARRLMFLEKLRDEIREALFDLEDGARE
ncbi:MAG: Fe-S protein assembly co-chaperone HscB [Zoogloeaceae bacterium]|jgi:molecular chaperone HscB|nr:Fe-S protein assembly co-chaperone HscB [Zoogloeaceae bacterium]